MEFKDLSKREREVALLIHGGKSLSEVAETLSISPKTVSKHRDNIYKTLDIHRASDLVLIVERQKGTANDTGNK